jgi:hypothetical protein
MTGTMAAGAMSSDLRRRVDQLLPGWESWYPSLFDAADDLGLIRARVCPPSALVLTNRHASIYNEAVAAFRRQWGVEDDPDSQSIATAAGRLELNRRKRRRGGRGGKR